MVGFLSGRRTAVEKRHMYARYIVAYFQHASPYARWK